MLSVAQPQLGKEALEGVVDRPPVDPGRLHRDGCYPGVHQERRELGQPRLGRGEPLLFQLHLSVAHLDADAGDHAVAMDVQATDSVSDLFQHHLLLLAEATISSPAGGRYGHGDSCELADREQAGCSPKGRKDSDRKDLG